MKKEYTEPQIKLLSGIDVVLLDATGVKGDVDDDPQIDFGGSDDEGTMDPEAKSFNMHSVWDD